MEQIRKDADMKNDKMVTYQKPERKCRKRYMVIALAATLAVGTATAYAAYTGWSKGLKEELRISEDQQNHMEENGMAAFSDATVTDAGVTVTAQQSITDNYYTYLSFKIDGYSVEQGVQPDFETISVTVDGQDDFSWGGSFYNGMISDENGMAVHADGSELETAVWNIIWYWPRVMKKAFLWEKICMWNLKILELWQKQTIHRILMEHGHWI